MRELTTQIHTAENSLTANRARDLAEAARRNLAVTRSQSSLEVGVVSNFDPDQRGFVTEAMQGFVMLQKQAGADSVGVLGLNGDYGHTAFAPGRNATIAAQPLRPVPGQPTIIYPVGSGNGSASLAYYKGGKVDYRRAYPALPLVKNSRTYFFGEGGYYGVNRYAPGGTVYTRSDCLVFLAIDGSGVWSENSPLPPGLRYVELEDVAASRFPPLETGNNINVRLANLGGITISAYRALLLKVNIDDPFTDFDSYLPHDSQNRGRFNPKPLPANTFYHLDEILLDDTYWTGEVQVDPYTWQDDYWDGLDRDPTGNTPRVNRDAMRTWLNAHPGAKFSS